jgi:hypothetical protein
VILYKYGYLTLRKLHLRGSLLSTYYSILLYVIVGIILLGPLFFIGQLNFDSSGEVMTATVALGAIFRSNGRNILRSSMMSAVRTVMRTFLRRLIRLALPILLRLFLPLFRTGKVTSEKQQSLPKAMVMGFVALSCSFFGVLMFSSKSPEIYNISPVISSLLAGTAVVFHFSYLFIMAQYLNVKVTMQTPGDGIFLQAYFTGAGSYLPLTSDMKLVGEDSDCGNCSSWTLSALLGTALFFDLIGILLSSPLLILWGAQLLLYTFVISFPLPPLEGYTVWKYSKTTWMALFVIIFLSFALNLPQEFHAIL